MQPLWKTVWRFLKKLKIFPYDPAIALLGIYPMDTNTVIQRGICTLMFIKAITKLWKESKIPINRWTDKEDVMRARAHTHTHTHTHNGILLSHQKGWILTVYINVDGTRGHYPEWNTLIRERQLSYGFIHIWNIRNRAEDHGGREWKQNGKSSERKKNHERLLTTGNKLKVAGEEVSVRMGSLGDGHEERLMI